MIYNGNGVQTELSNRELSVVYANFTPRYSIHINNGKQEGTFRGLFSFKYLSFRGRLHRLTERLYKVVFFWI